MHAIYTDVHLHVLRPRKVVGSLEERPALC